MPLGGDGRACMEAAACPAVVYGDRLAIQSGVHSQGIGAVLRVEGGLVATIA